MLRAPVAIATPVLGAVAGHEYEPPTAENDGWSVGSAAEAGSDVQMLGAMVEHVCDRNNCAVRRILIITDDTLVSMTAGPCSGQWGY